MTREDTVFSPPSATAFDALTSLTSAGVYMIVALAALAQAPHDARVRVFFAVALAGIAPYWITAQIWVWGWPKALSKGAVVFVVLSLMMGSVALFHFTQVFPWRRPWIKAYGSRLWAAYVVIPALTALVAFITPSFTRGGSGGFGAVSPGLTVLLLLAAVGSAMTIVVALGIIVPFAGLLSLYKSFLVARTRGIESARRTTLLMLVSQLGGGALTILVVPLMRLMTPSGPLVTIASGLLFACAMLMPLAFAIGVWRLHVLELDIDALPQ
ncbi:MAG TPA: hypothetical protein VFK57_25760 [Vicinamibacterales bacterium]|nr:hypothetical protein [Vicinamibacterales bacterium]